MKDEYRQEIINVTRKIASLNEVLTRTETGPYPDQEHSGCSIIYVTYVMVHLRGGLSTLRCGVEWYLFLS